MIIERSITFKNDFVFIINIYSLLFESKGILLTSSKYGFLAVKTHKKRMAKKMKNINKEMIGYISIPSIPSI
ncbi:hypothetical protein LPB138_08205 [Urechidicola croceus]|uniref:Uncharacterized protein n=1 Tax=Urechidicola croceus TaxID=1850246 RepID=A0A1D8P7V1_9FLAO|nr:hypothetical protein LPB138_08205 [Urechidicola croceus]